MNGHLKLSGAPFKCVTAILAVSEKATVKANHEAAILMNMKPALASGDWVQNPKPKIEGQHPAAMSARAIMKPWNWN